MFHGFGRIQDQLDLGSAQLLDAQQIFLMQLHALSLLLFTIFAEHDTVFPVDFADLDMDNFIAGGRHILAGIIGPDRQFAMAAVDQDRQLDLLGPAEVEQRLDRRPARSGRCRARRRPGPASCHGWRTAAKCR